MSWNLITSDIETWQHDNGDIIIVDKIDDSELPYEITISYNYHTQKISFKTSYLFKDYFLKQSKLFIENSYKSELNLYF